MSRSSSVGCSANPTVTALLATLHARPTTGTALRTTWSPNAAPRCAALTHSQSDQAAALTVHTTPPITHMVTVIWSFSRIFVPQLGVSS